LVISAGACAPSLFGIIAYHVAPRARGTAMGFFESACGVSFILAGFVGGQAAEALGPEVPYLLFGALALAWAPVLARHAAGQPARRPA
jgi:predicted MFS family arabinose efflux permease